MTKNQIVRMAKQAGAASVDNNGWIFSNADLVKFVEIIAEAVRCVDSKRHRKELVALIKRIQRGDEK